MLFPVVVVAHDLTAALFSYVLHNLQSTNRYGRRASAPNAANHVVAIILADGEFTSNLQLTKALYDALVTDGARTPAQPVKPQDVIAIMSATVASLRQSSGVALYSLAGSNEMLLASRGASGRSADWLRRDIGCDTTAAVSSTRLLLCRHTR